MKKVTRESAENTDARDENVQLLDYFGKTGVVFLGTKWKKIINDLDSLNRGRLFNFCGCQFNRSSYKTPSKRSKGRPEGKLLLSGYDLPMGMVEIEWFGAFARGRNKHLKENHLQGYGTRIGRRDWLDCSSCSWHKLSELNCMILWLILEFEILFAFVNLCFETVML